MNSRSIRRGAVAALCIVFGFSVGMAEADVTIERSISVEGVGAMALGNMTGTTRTLISGERSRTDSETKMQSKIVGFLARNAAGPSAEIVLLDQDKLYHLNMNKKEYTETTFEQIRAQLQKISEQADSNENKQQPSAVDQSKCQWLPAKVAVNKTGEKAQIAGYDSERVTITASQPCQDKETGSICEVTLIMDQWTSAGYTDSAEEKKYRSAYANKMGVDSAVSQDASERAKLMFSQYKGIWTEVASKMKDVKGYPVKSSFTLALGGAQCKDTNAQQGQTRQSQADNSFGPGGIAGALDSSLGGFFHKNKSDAATPAAAPTPAATPVAVPAGDVALMTVSSQLLSVSTTAAGADSFLVPANFKKVELRTQ